MPTVNPKVSASEAEVIQTWNYVVDLANALNPTQKPIEAKIQNLEGWLTLSPQVRRQVAGIWSGQAQFLQPRAMSEKVDRVFDQLSQASQFVEGLKAIVQTHHTPMEIAAQALSKGLSKLLRGADQKAMEAELKRIQSAEVERAVGESLAAANSRREEEEKLNAYLREGISELRGRIQKEPASYPQTLYLYLDFFDRLIQLDPALSIRHHRKENSGISAELYEEYEALTAITGLKILGDSNKRSVPYTSLEPRDRQVLEHFCLLMGMEPAQLFSVLEDRNNHALKKSKVFDSLLMRLTMPDRLKRIPEIRDFYHYNQAQDTPELYRALATRALSAFQGDWASNITYIYQEGGIKRVMETRLRDTHKKLGKR